MLTFLKIAGGAALILFGVRFLRTGLDRLFGPRLSRWIQRLAGNRLRALLSGAGISVLAPSSTAISMLAVQAVQAGHLSAREMMAVMLGANVGMTAMVVLISLQLEQYAPLLMLVGVTLSQFTSRVRTRGTGQVVLSLGFILFAIAIIKNAAGETAPDGDLNTLLELVQGYPVWLAMLAALVAVAMQSSTAAIGLMIGLAAAERVQLELAVPVVIGANIGIALTTMLFGWSQVESRRLGLANLIAVTVTALICLASLPLALDLLAWAPVGPEKQIAIAHSSFNVLLAMLFLPLIRPTTALVRWLIPKRADAGQEPFGPRYISQSRVDGLSLGLGQSLREILRVCEIVRGMLEDLWRALENRNVALAEQVQQRDDQVDLLDSEIKRFLVRLCGLEGGPDQTGEAMRQLRYLSELETIGDVIDKNLAELVIKRARKEIDFSPEGWGELDDFYRKVYENIIIAETAFTTRDRILARQLLRHKQRISEYERELRDRHLDRLRLGRSQTHESSAIHLDLLTHLKRINSCVTHVAYAIIQGEEQQT